ncbi:MAG: hypothetical protein ACXWTH_01715 [Methylosarcina sp.]
MIDPTNMQKVACCAGMAMQHATFSDSDATSHATPNATNNLKTLAGAVLERNSQRNANATDAEKQCNFATKNCTEKLHPVAPDFTEKNKSADRLKPEDKAAILRWLTYINENSQPIIDDVLDCCVKNKEALQYYLARAREVRP